jgi:hypothetical protein
MQRDPAFPASVKSSRSGKTRIRCALEKSFAHIPLMTLSISPHQIPHPEDEVGGNPFLPEPRTPLRVREALAPWLTTWA